MDPDPSQPQAATSQDPLYDASATREERSWGLYNHLTTLILPGLPLIPAIVMWQSRRHRSPFLDDHGKEVVNFQITIAIYVAIGWILQHIFPVGNNIYSVVLAFAIISAFRGAHAAQHGKYFRYPACLRFLY